MTAASPGSLVRRGYPGWRMAWALAVTETISYGVLYYSFAAFLLPMQHALGSSQTAVGQGRGNQIGMQPLRRLALPVQLAVAGPGRSCPGPSRIL